MTECCTNTFNAQSVGGGFATSEVTLFDMVATAAYCTVTVVETAWRRYSAHRKTIRALDTLERLDDRHLADMGISREDLTIEGLAEAAAKREQAIASMGNRA